MPPASPMPTAATVLAPAKPRPTPAAVSTNISGSMIGDASQKAMTGASGTPARSIAAMRGMTPHEQNGDRAPTTAARTTVRPGLPEKARAIRRSAPLAAAYAAMATARTRKGAIPTSAPATKRRLSGSWAGVQHAECDRGRARET